MRRLARPESRKRSGAADSGGQDALPRDPQARRRALPQRAGDLDVAAVRLQNLAGERQPAADALGRAHEGVGAALEGPRSEERRDGKECVGPGRSRWAAATSKKKTNDYEKVM